MDFWGIFRSSHSEVFWKYAANLEENTQNNDHTEVQFQ